MPHLISKLEPGGQIHFQFVSRQEITRMQIEYRHFMTTLGSWEIYESVEHLPFVTLIFIKPMQE